MDKGEGVKKSENFVDIISGSSLRESCGMYLPKTNRLHCTHEIMAIYIMCVSW